MSPPVLPRVPLSRKLVVGVLAAAAGAVLPLIGVYHLSAPAQALVSAGEAFAAGWIVKEERRYLASAEAARDQGR